MWSHQIHESRDPHHPFPGRIILLDYMRTTIGTTLILFEFFNRSCKRRKAYFLPLKFIYWLPVNEKISKEVGSDTDRCSSD